MKTALAHLRISCLQTLAPALVLLAWPMPLRAEIKHDPDRKTWQLISGPVEYRLRQSEDRIGLDYFGPGERSRAADATNAWPPAATGYIDFAARINGLPVQPEDLQLIAHNIAPIQPGVDALQLTLKHRQAPVELVLTYRAWANTGVITRKVSLVNQGNQTIAVESLPSLAWRLPSGQYELSYLWGAWGRERQYGGEILTPGRREFVNRTGRSTHGYSPWFSLYNDKLKLRYLAQLAWSGNWQMAFERTPGPRPFPEENLNVELGLRFDNRGPLRVKPGDAFLFPEVAFTATEGDLDQAANQMHRYQRQFVVAKTPANDPPLVQFNSWYPFPGKMTVADMKRCASIAAELGAEVFVLDAGWYNKKDWSRELGDWQADPVAFPKGVEELAQHVHGLGMKFGIWVEIENFGVDSQMYKDHPDWCLNWQGKPLENQVRHPVNFAKPEVRQWARGVLDRLVRAYNLDWVKIDYNIDIGETFDPAGPDAGGDVLYRHVLGYYAWLDDLRSAYPNLVVENCSSGGLRFDLGIIGHTHTTWLSDEILPLPSLQLAFGSTLEFTPAICNHWMVGEKNDGTADPNKPPGWWDFMFRVPMNGQFGLSSRVLDWPPAIRQRARDNVALYKRIRPIIQNADVYHLTPPPDHEQPTGWMVLQYVTETRQQSVLMSYRLAQSQAEWAVKLRGLEEDQYYLVRENGAPRGLFQGAQLLRRGLPLRLDEEWRASVFELVATNVGPTAHLDGRRVGGTFEGIGALSAGASSRLLIDYAEPYRSQILDFLFKPDFGASFQHLKVEVGGDINSTDGCEPSHMRTRDDRNFQRGYEWWLMKEARKRNAKIFLDCLQWGAPAWIGNGHFYSQDNANFLVEFLKGARDVHGLNIEYAGVWNETRYDTGWIKLFRKTLDQQGFKSVKLVAADEISRWSIVDVMQTDPELAQAVAIVGTHYPKFKSPPAAQQCGKPIWSSEDGPWRGNWDGARELARMYNRNYIEGKMTKTIVWSPVTSYYDILPLPGSGMMRANEPWSGHYEVQPALWATAHTTQFAKPGWVYLEGEACGYLPEGGSYVTLKSPNGHDYSVIIETTDAAAAQTVAFVQDGGLSGDTLHIWRSSVADQFVPLPDLKPINGSYTVRLDRGCLYSLTTTSGQKKGIPTAPPSARFPASHADDFETYEPGATPKYFSDQAGIFEVSKRADGKGNCLRQVINRKGIEWHLHQDPCPETFLGDADWRNYDFSVDVFIEEQGYASLFGRVAKIVQKPVLPEGYWLKVADTGYWELGTAAIPLASGKADVKPNQWHNVKLQFDDWVTRVFIDGKWAGASTNDAYVAGMVGIGSGWHHAQFDNLRIVPR